MSTKWGVYGCDEEGGFHFGMEYNKVLICEYDDEEEAKAKAQELNWPKDGNRVGYDYYRVDEIENEQRS